MAVGSPVAQPVGVGKEETGVRQMKRKRMIKLLMSVGCDRNDAVKATNLCDGRIPHAVLYYDLLGEFIRAYSDQLDKTVVEGDMTGEVAGMVGSVYG